VTEEGKPPLLRRWSRRATTWIAGAAALVACGSAAAVVATSGDSPRPKPSNSASNAALTTKNALASILHANPDLGQPVAALISQGKLPKASYAGDNGRVGVPAGVKAAPTAATGAVPSFVPGPSSGDYSFLQMASLALSQGCPASEAPIAGAIGAAESGGDPGAQGDVTLMDGTWDWSEGLWQIRGLRSERGTGGLRDSLANADPVNDAKAMMVISNGCTDWTPWSTYNSGAYLAYLSSMQAAVAAANQYHLKTGSYPPVGSGASASVPSAETTISSSVPTHPVTRRTGTHAAARSTSAAPSHQPSPAASSSAARKTPTPHPSSSPSSSKSKVPTLPIKTSLPVKLPTLPTKSPSLPVKLPTSISVPPLLPGLP
jgi:hypothetical protein